MDLEIIIFTETACFYFLKVIQINLDKAEVVASLFLKLYEAFDAVNHPILLSMLSNSKLSVDAQNWVKLDRSGHSQSFMNFHQ